MNPQDRQLLGALQQRQLNLEIAVNSLRADLRDLAARLETPATLPPPVPDLAPEPQRELPPLPHIQEAPEQTSPPAPPIPPIATAPLEPVPTAPSLEIQFGRWLARIGVVFALLTLVYFSVVTYRDWLQYAGPWTKLGLLALASVGLIGGGLRLERRSTDLVVYGRTLAGGGLACLYYTLYGATYVPQLHVITNVYLGGILLLAWSAGVLWLAERRKSELLSIFAISLAYFSSAITPVGEFTMAADLLLAVTAVVFLIRNAWTGLSWLCLIGTCLGFVRQIITDSPDVISGFNFVHEATAFWPWAIYLTGAWLIFTAGVFLAHAPGFDGGKRLAFLSLNNSAWAGFLIVAAELSSHGYIGGLLLLVGAALLGAYAVARFLRTDAAELAGAYLLQGLAIGTAGLVVYYHGVTRGLIITAESVILAAAGSSSRNPILRFCAGLAAMLGVAFLLGETIDKAPFPWWLMAAGSAAMLASAWLTRWFQASGHVSLSRAVYIGLALVLGIRWIYGVVPDSEITLALFAVASALIVGGLVGSSGYLLRAGLVLDVVGCGNYILAGHDIDVHPFTWLDAGAFVFFLAQPALLRHWGRAWVGHFESGAVAIVSGLMAWLFVSNSISAAQSQNLTLGWALLALALIVLGFIAQERRQRWCGLGILVAAFVRVGVHDFWGFSDIGKVLTFFALTVICLGLSFLYYKYAERFKAWL